MHAAFLTHFILLDFIILLSLGEEWIYETNSSLCSSLQPLLASFV
jgi:hypothetical protein